MIPKMYVGMALTTVALAVIGVVLVQNRESATAASGTDELLFPEFESSINDVTAVKIETADGAFTVARDAEGDWGMAEKGGYPADASKVRKLLFALKDAKGLEQKTSDPARYERLGVEDITAPESQSSKVTALDANGKELAGLFLGKLRPAQGGSRTTAYYVRKEDESAAWLAEGDLTVDKTQKGWLEKDIIDLSRDRVRAVRITHLDGEIVYVRKPDKTATDFEIVDMPEGKVPTYASAPNSLATGLARLTMDDVVPAAEHELGNPPEAVCTFWTFDGLKVTVTTEEKEDTLYARIEAAYDEEGPPGAPPIVAPPPPPPAEGEEAAAPADEGPTPDEVTAEAEELNAKVGEWIYVLPSWKKSTFMKRMDEMVKDAPAPEPEETEDAEAVPEISDPLPPPPPVEDGAKAGEAEKTEGGDGAKQDAGDTDTGDGDAGDTGGDDGDDGTDG